MSRARYLMDQLLSNALSKDELDELLSSLGDGQTASECSDILEHFFYQLLHDQELSKNENLKKKQ